MMFLLCSSSIWNNFSVIANISLHKIHIKHIVRLLTAFDCVFVAYARGFWIFCTHSLVNAADAATTAPSSSSITTTFISINQLAISERERRFKLKFSFKITSNSCLCFLSFFSRCFVVYLFEPIAVNPFVYCRHRRRCRRCRRRRCLLLIILLLLCRRRHFFVFFFSVSLALLFSTPFAPFICQNFNTSKRISFVEKHRTAPPYRFQ